MSISQLLANYHKSERKLTRVTLIVAAVIIITRLAYLVEKITAYIYQIAFRFNLFGEVIKWHSFLDCIRQICLLIFFLLHSFNGIIYVRMDKNTYRLVKNYFKRFKVNILYIYIVGSLIY